MGIWPARAVGESLQPCVSDSTEGQRWHSPGLLLTFCYRKPQLWGLIMAVRARGQTSQGVAGLASDTSAAFPGETPCRHHEVSIRIKAGGAASVRGMKPAWTIEAMRILPPQNGHGGSPGSSVVASPTPQGSGAGAATPSNTRIRARLAARLPLARRP